MSDIKSINIVGDDGNVYSISVSDLPKIAKKVPVSKLSPDAQSAAHSRSHAPAAHSQIFASHSDIFSAKKDEIDAAPTIHHIFASHAIFSEGGSGDK